MPVRLQEIDLIKPCTPPPTMKNEAQAVKVTQTGMGITVAVRKTSTPPRTPMLVLKASDCFMIDYVLSQIDH
jgi:hypothetical protein